MAKRFDVVAPQKVTRGGEEKTYWNKIGSMWQDGDKMRLNLEMVPIGWDGFALISEPKEKTQQAPGKSSGNNSGGSRNNDSFPDDELPPF